MNEKRKRSEEYKKEANQVAPINNATLKILICDFVECAFLLEKSFVQKNIKNKGALAKTCV